MYTATVYNGGEATVIHGGTRLLANAVIVKEKNAIDSFSFDIYPTQTGWDRLEPFITTVQVVNSKTGEIEFDGRVLKPAAKMDSKGVAMKSVVCEGVAAYLHDSVQTYADSKRWTSASAFIKHLLDTHNSKMPDEKKIYAGSVDYVTWLSTRGFNSEVPRENTWKCLHDVLIDEFGGEIQVRRAEDGKLYLDYSKKLGETRSTKITLGRNMKDASREIDPSAVVTRLYPFGAKITKTGTDEDGNEYEYQTEERVTISSAYNGKRYIDDTVAMAKFGIIEGVQIFDDVETSSELLSLGQSWLSEANTVPVSNRIKAFDLSLIGLDSDSFRLHDWYPCHNPLIELDETLEIVKQSINISEPSKSTIEFGDTSLALSRFTAKNPAWMTRFKSMESFMQLQIDNMRKRTNSSISKVSSKVDTHETTISNHTTTINSHTTAISDLSDDIDALKESAGSGNEPVTLYSGSTTGNVTLSETSANFSYIDIECSYSDGVVAVVERVYNPNGRTVDVAAHNVATNGAGWSRVRYKISGKTMTASANYKASVKDGTTWTYDTNNLYCTRVVGYR